MNKKLSLLLIGLLGFTPVLFSQDFKALYATKFDPSKIMAAGLPQQKPLENRAAVVFWSDHLTQASKVSSAEGGQREAFMKQLTSTQAMTAMFAPLPGMREEIRAERRDGPKLRGAIASKERRIELRMRQLVTGLRSARAQNSVREPFTPLCGEVASKEAFIEYSSLAFSLIGEPTVMIVDVVGDNGATHTFGLARLRSNTALFFDPLVGEIGYQTNRPRKFEGAITDALARSLAAIGAKDGSEFGISVFLLPPPVPKGGAGITSSSPGTPGAVPSAPVAGGSGAAKTGKMVLTDTKMRFNSKTLRPAEGAGFGWSHTKSTGKWSWGMQGVKTAEHKDYVASVTVLMVNGGPAREGAWNFDRTKETWVWDQAAPSGPAPAPPVAAAAKRTVLKKCAVLFNATTSRPVAPSAGGGWHATSASSGYRWGLASRRTATTAQKAYQFDATVDVDANGKPAANGSWQFIALSGQPKAWAWIADQ